MIVIDTYITMYGSHKDLHHWVWQFIETYIVMYFTYIRLLLCVHVYWSNISGKLNRWELCIGNHHAVAPAFIYVITAAQNNVCQRVHMGSLLGLNIYVICCTIYICDIKHDIIMYAKEYTWVLY